MRYIAISWRVRDPKYFLDMIAVFPRTTKASMCEWLLEVYDVCTSTSTFRRQFALEGTRQSIIRRSNPNFGATFELITSAEATEFYTENYQKMLMGDVRISFVNGSEVKAEELNFIGPESDPRFIRNMTKWNGSSLVWIPR